MSVQGRALKPEQVERIVELLSDTELTISEIAQRMECSRSAVLSVNRRRKVRAYRGLRTTWESVNPKVEESLTTRSAELPN